MRASSPLPPQPQSADTKVSATFAQPLQVACRQPDFFRLRSGRSLDRRFCLSVIPNRVCGVRNLSGIAPKSAPLAKTLTASGMTSQVSGRVGALAALFQVKATAEIIISKLLHYPEAGAYQLHAFVLMPNHLRLLLTPGATTSLEKKPCNSSRAEARMKSAGSGGRAWRFGKRVLTKKRCATKRTIGPNCAT